MEYGRYGRELLLELKRHDEEDSTNNNTTTGSTHKGGRISPYYYGVAPYNAATVALCLEDLALHVQTLQDQVTVESRRQELAADGNRGSGGSLRSRPSILLHTAAIRRNKRCLLTYHWVRLQRMQNAAYWQQQQSPPPPRQEDATTVEPPPTDAHQLQPQQQPQQPLSPLEQKFLQRYEQLQVTYVQRALSDLAIHDLRAHGLVPPLNDDRVVIRILEEHPDGPVVLPSGQILHFIVGSTQYLLWSDVEEWIRAGKMILVQGEEQQDYS